MAATFYRPWLARMFWLSFQNFITSCDTSNNSNSFAWWRDSLCWPTTKLTTAAQRPAEDIPQVLHMKYVVFHPHYLKQLNSPENHKSQLWQMLFGDLETAAVLNHLDMTYNLYMTVALYYNVYHGVKAQHFLTYATITLIMSQENIMMLSLFLWL